MDLADAAETILTRLRVRGETLGLAESCTGGLVASTLTDVTGASKVLDRGVVAYTPRAKRDLLGVDDATLQTEASVGVSTARQMAEGIRDRGDVDWGLATTGFAGPSGGTETDPVGTVYVGVAWRRRGGGAEVTRHRFEGGRRQVKRWMTKAALDELQGVVERG